jgi:hypothetical protein
MTKYTFTFDPSDEGKFRQVLSRLDPEEYSVVEDVRPIDHKEGLDEYDLRRLDRQMILEMDPEAALTFRLGMKSVKIRRERTEEELAEEAELKAKNTVKITVMVPPTSSPGP